jgi:hypothetical protein
MPIPTSTPLTPTQITDYASTFFEFFPYMTIAIDPVKGFTQLEVENIIPKAWYYIPVKCNRKRDEILVNVIVHLLLKEREDSEAFKKGDNGIAEKVQNFELGDIKIDLAKTEEISDSDVFWYTSKYGKRAKFLMRMCAKSRIGIII